MIEVCNGIAPGVPVLACLSEASNYVPGYVFLVLLVAVLFYSLNREATPERIATILFVTAIVTAAGSVSSMLFPPQFYVVAAVLFLGSLGMLFWRREGF